MKKLTVLLLCLLPLSQVQADAKTKPRCKKRSIEVSCESVKDAKRDFFCWRKKKGKELSDASKTKICQKARRKKKARK
jgi:hypothetical protein